MSDDLASAGGGTAARLFAVQPLLRAVGIAGEARKLALGAIMLLVLAAGLWGLAYLFQAAPTVALPLQDLSEPRISAAIGTDQFAEWVMRAAEPFRLTIGPFLVLFSPQSNASARVHAILSVVWAVLVFGLFGVAIARIAVVQLATGERVGFGTALKFAAKRWPSSISAPLAPFLMISLLVAILSLGGLVSAIPGDIPKILVSLTLILPLVIGAIIAVILLGLAFCWPLMHLTIAAEGEDMFDALSRSYSYFNQRRGHYVIQTLLAGVLGAIGALVFAVAAQIAVAIAFWGLSLGGGPGVGYQGPLAADVLRTLWLYGVQLVVLAWGLSYFWSAFAAIYLGLRKDVDGVPWHDVYVPEHERDTFAPEPAADAPAAE